MGESGEWPRSSLLSRNGDEGNGGTEAVSAVGMVMKEMGL